MKWRYIDKGDFPKHEEVVLADYGEDYGYCLAQFMQYDKIKDWSEDDIWVDEYTGGELLGAPIRWLRLTRPKTK